MLIILSSKHFQNNVENTSQCKVLQFVSEKGADSVIIRQVFKNGIRMCVTFQREFVVLEQKMDLIIRVAFIPHHTTGGL